MLSSSFKNEKIKNSIVKLFHSVYATRTAKYILILPFKLSIVWWIDAQLRPQNWILIQFRHNVKTPTHCPLLLVHAWRKVTAVHLENMIVDTSHNGKKWCYLLCSLTWTITESKDTGIYATIIIKQTCTLVPKATAFITRVHFLTWMLSFDVMQCMCV